MVVKSLLNFAAALLLLADHSAALKFPGYKPQGRQAANAKFLDKRQYFPENATDVKTIVTPTNVTIRYKNPGEAGVCETTEGVSYRRKQSSINSTDGEHCARRSTAMRDTSILAPMFTSSFGFLSHDRIPQKTL